MRIGALILRLRAKLRPDISFAAVISDNKVIDNEENTLFFGCTASDAGSGIFEVMVCKQ